MIYVQHLLGVGHLQRARGLARALLQQGFRVELVSGGRPLAGFSEPGIGLHQLAPVHCPDATFSRLLDASGNDIDDRWRDSRRQQLLELFDRLSPRVLITETFPFGRRMMRFELLPLLQRARERRGTRLVLASIRDILQPKTKPGRNRETCELIEKYYDYVLVHGDPEVATLAHSFAAAGRIEDRLFYSGYICAGGAAAESATAATAGVLVSAGGSDTGFEILKTALEARPLTRLAHEHWRLLVSPAIGEAEFTRLRRDAEDRVSVERNRPDFPLLVQNARLSISQAGYNTVTDILRSRAAAVLIPFDQADEVEQGLRAERLRHRGRVAVLKTDRLDAANLAASMEQALALDTSIGVDLDGAAKSAAQIQTWLQQAET